VANLRISLGIEVRPGKEYTAAIGMPILWQTLQSLPRSQWPTLARADCAYGNEAIINEFEERELPYLFKPRHSPRVKQLVRELLQQSEGWREAGEGWEAAEAKLPLHPGLCSKISKRRGMFLDLAEDGVHPGALLAR
jgi:hypothetical protein